MKHVCVWGILAGVAGLGCSSQRADRERPIRAEDQAVTGPISLQIQTPNGVPSLAPVLLASSSMAIGAGARVAQPPSSAAPSLALGTAGVSTQPDAVLGEIWSRGPVDLRDRVQVRGRVHARVVTTGNGTVVTDGVDATPIADPLTTRTWTVQWPATPGPDAILEPDQSRTLAAGAFGTVRIASRARLALTAGTYYVQSLDVEPGAVVRLVQDTGPVVIYVADSVIYRGSFTTSNGAPPDLVLAAVAPTTVFVEAPFDGALLVPGGGIVLRQGAHAGFFAARDITVDAHAEVRYRAPNALSSAIAPPGTSIQQCADLIQPDPGLSGPARDVAYQTAIARYCTLSGSGRTLCSASLAGRGNVEYALAALQLIHQSIDPAHYLAAVRDRSRKLQAARNDAAFAAVLCSGPDTDGDWIPDPLDRCPATPPLTATDDQGCPTGALPDAPSAVDVHTVLATINVPFRAACANASMPPRATAGAFYRPAQREKGVYILAARAAGQPPGCPVWYEFDIQETSPSTGSAVLEYRVAFMDREASNDLVGLGQPVPALAIQFNPLPTDPGTRGQLGSAGGSSVRFRVRAMNGAGQRSDWSDWRITTNDDCIALGFQCG
jgi:hypothetical protein